MILGIQLAPITIKSILVEHSSPQAKPDEWMLIDVKVQMFWSAPKHTDERANKWTDDQFCTFKFGRLSND